LLKYVTGSEKGSSLSGLDKGGHRSIIVVEAIAMFDRITADPRQMGGVPCIRGLRIPVSTIVGMIADGMSSSEVLDAYPDLESEDIVQALRYAAYLTKDREIELAHS
jgi:uncharacterized protein (DUF433 family)